MTNEPLWGYYSCLLLPLLLSDLYKITWRMDILFDVCILQTNWPHYAE